MGNFKPTPESRLKKKKQRNASLRLKGLSEQVVMQHQASARITFGVFNLLKPPKPDDEISYFTVAFSKPVRKRDLYARLDEALGNHWDPGTVKSIFIHLSNPPKWKETRKRIKEALEDLLVEPEETS